MAASGGLTDLPLVAHLWCTIGVSSGFGLRFACDAPKVWNDLPDDVVSATSLSSIRKRGHGGRVVTLSPPTSEAGVRSPHGLKWESW